MIVRRRKRYVGLKRCPVCGVHKPPEDFYIDRSKASGRRSPCKACDLKKSRAHYQRNRERVIARVKARQAEQKAAA
jgi:hypothetical protein